MLRANYLRLFVDLGGRRLAGLQGLQRRHRKRRDALRAFLVHRGVSDRRFQRPGPPAGGLPLIIQYHLRR